MRRFHMRHAQQTAARSTRSTVCRPWCLACCATRWRLHWRSWASYGTEHMRGTCFWTWWWDIVIAAVHHVGSLELYSCPKCRLALLISAQWHLYFALKNLRSKPNDMFCRLNTITDSLQLPGKYCCPATSPVKAPHANVLVSLVLSRSNIPQNVF